MDPVELRIVIGQTETTRETSNVDAALRADATDAGPAPTADPAFTATATGELAATHDVDDGGAAPSAPPSVGAGGVMTATDEMLDAGAAPDAPAAAETNDQEALS